MILMVGPGEGSKSLVKGNPASRKRHGAGPAPDLPRTGDESVAALRLSR